MQKNRTECIAEQLRAEISAGDYKVNERLPSAVVLGNRFSVTKETINMAFSHLVSAGLVYRKRGSGTYVADFVKLHSGEKRFIGVYFPRAISPDATPSSFAIFQGITFALAARDFYPVLLTEENFNYEKFKKLNVCGVTIPGGNCTVFNKIVPDLTKFKIPYILLDRFMLDESINYVEEYSANEIYKTVQCLQSRGHKRIAGIGFDSEKLVFRNFFIGYEQAMREKFLYDPELAKCVSECSERELNAVVGELFDLKVPPTAIFVFYRNALDALYQALQNKKIRIPEDVSLVCAGNPVVKNNVEIATLGINKEEFGKKAGNLLLDLIEGKINPPINHKLKLNFAEGTSINTI